MAVKTEVKLGDYIYRGKYNKNGIARTPCKCYRVIGLNPVIKLQRYKGEEIIETLEMTKEQVECLYQQAGIFSNLDHQWLGDF